MKEQNKITEHLHAYTLAHLNSYTHAPLHACTRLRLHTLTLIELVIVCAIIAVLVGIVWVVMAPAREKARQAVCISNLTQIGHAFRMYRDDWDGVEPQKGIQLEYWQLGLPPGIGIYSRLQPYTKNMNIFICPSYIVKHGIILGTTYTMNYCNHDICALHGLHYDYCILRFIGEESFRVIIAKYPDWPIYYCDNHNYNLPKGWEDELLFTINLPDFSVKRIYDSEANLLFSE
ncbi:hypothetical protein B0813_003312 [Candidatus Fervidibacteria bacterium JGI MDM2 SSWTFF-3-K9]